MTSAVLDSCVLYSAALRDLFMRLAVGFVFQPKWTTEIHDEWMRNVLANRPDLTRQQIERTRQLMDNWGRDWSVPDCSKLIPKLMLPDPDDRHVLAAAISSKTPLIVTFNLSDFPTAAVAPYGVRVLHPDRFLRELFDEELETFLEVVRKHRAALTSPSKTAAEYRATLSAHGLPAIAAILEQYADRI